MDNLKSEIYDLVADEIGIDKSEFNDDTLLFSDGYIDSFTMTTLLEFIEEKAEIVIDPMDVSVENFDSIGRMMIFIAEAKA